MHPGSVSRIIRQITARNGDTKSAYRAHTPTTKTTPTNVRRVQDMARDNPVRNMKDIQQLIGCGATSARTLVKKAGLKSLGSIKVPMVSTAARQKRVERSEALLEWLEANERSRHPRIVLYTDEKNFVVDMVVNRRNRRVLVPARDINVQAVPSSKHPCP